jgi:hypothetical protein
MVACVSLSGKGCQVHIVYIVIFYIPYVPVSLPET